MEQYVAGVRVLLAACARGALAEGEAAARFLYYRASTLQRHPSLAYSATKAAAQYAALAHDRQVFLHPNENHFKSNNEKLSNLKLI